jgi:hypothetical protein
MFLCPTEINILIYSLTETNYTLRLLWFRLAKGNIQILKEGKDVARTVARNTKYYHNTNSPQVGQPQIGQTTGQRQSIGRYKKSSARSVQNTRAPTFTFSLHERSQHKGDKLSHRTLVQNWIASSSKVYSFSGSWWKARAKCDIQKIGYQDLLKYNVLCY